MPPTPYTTAQRAAAQREASRDNGRERQAPGVVHESTAQRQHVRVRLPGLVEFPIGKETARFRLYDLSAGGLSFDSNGRAFRSGESFKGSVILNLDGVAITLFVSFVVRTYDARHGRTGVRFQELGPQEISVLRHVITSYLSGDVVSVGDVLQTLGRDNFTKARSVAAEAVDEQPRSRAGAVLMTVVLVCLGALAFAWTAQRVNRALFASVAIAGKVAGPTYSIVMPREGTFFSLVPEDGLVKKGAPIASFEAPVMDLVRSQMLGANLTPDQLQKLLKVTVKGTITSPCDCRVQTQFVASQQYVARDQPLFELMPRDFTPYVVARFRQDEISDLDQGARVTFRIAGDKATRSGRIARVRALGHGELVDVDIMATIEPDEPLPSELLGRPAEVVAGGAGKLAGLLPAPARRRAEPAPAPRTAPDAAEAPEAGAPADDAE